jgi:hypothetical protein
MSDRLDQSAKTCQTCRHWAGKRFEKAGECHRYPPATYYSSQGGKAVFRWPESPKTGWCAEWRRVEPGAGGLVENLALEPVGD